MVPFVDHCALGFYAIETESWPNQAPFLLQLRRRLEHMEVPDPANPANTVTALSLLRFVYTDTCCEGANDPTKHPIVDIFPHVLRAPYADGFHKTKLLLDACHSGAEQAMRTSFSRGIGAALRKPVEADYPPVVEWLTRRGDARGRGSSMAGAAAEIEARSKLFRAHGEVRTEGRPKDIIKKDFDEVIATHKRVSDANKDKGMKPLFKESSDYWRMGTEAQANAVSKCIEKGCLTDPLAVENMYIEYGKGPDTKLPHRFNKGQSTKNEALHKNLNALVHNIGHQNAEQLGKRIMLRLYRHNQDQDRKLGRKHPSVLPFWVQIALNKQAAGLLADAPFASPRKSLERKHDSIPRDHPAWEPLGFEHLEAETTLRIKQFWEAERAGGAAIDWDKINAAIDGTLELPGPVEAEETLGGPSKKQKKPKSNASRVEKNVSPGLLRNKVAPPTSECEVQYATELAGAAFGEQRSGKSNTKKELALWNNVADKYNNRYLAEAVAAADSNQPLPRPAARLSALTDAGLLKRWWNDIEKKKRVRTLT